MFLALVVKAFKSFQMFPVPEGESGQNCGGSWSWRVLDGRDIYAHPRREARPRVHLRYRSPTAMSSDYVPRVETGWRDGPPARAKVEPEESHN